ncbi:MAG: RNA-binding transcriptional accessory protein [Myxococcales bacterium]|nr:RNA-binding transcriptional accessory protein [Myxococcales bacterium]
MSTTSEPTAHAARIAQELNLPVRGVAAALELLLGGATVPFVARYRKEVTGGLDEVQLRALFERAEELKELDERRAAILESIREQGLMTPKLEAALLAATTRVVLEDLYLPYKPKRRTRASDARDRGLLPLADALLRQESGKRPNDLAAAFLGPDVPDVAAALAGARDILAERLSDDARMRARVRDIAWRFAVFTSKRSRSSKKDAKDAAPGQADPAETYRDYFDFAEPVRKIPSHRVLALRRGAAEKVLTTSVELELPALVAELAPLVPIGRAPSSDEVRTALEDGLARLLLPSIEREVIAELESRADVSAAQVFARNLEAVLLAAPLGPRRVVAIDPGLRTGMKCVGLDETGRYLGTVTVYAHVDSGRARAQDELAAFVKRHRPDAIAVGNGTGGREAMALARAVNKHLRDTTGQGIPVLEVAETGASVYSASDVARQEFPDLDLTIRGAISIGRRLQDPLAELVKIEPRSLGLGQYQHDVDEKLLDASLSAVVEDCVNRVGVLLNSASPSLLGYVAGIGPGLARKIVSHRDERGPFKSRKALLDVAGIGPKTFEQCAGFLRVPGSPEPLDASGVHPERYALVGTMAKDAGTTVAALVGKAWQGPPIDRYLSADVGRPTLEHILTEIARPGRDPRPAFEAPAWREDVTTLDDVKPGMVLPGVVTNVTQFGAFVDVGVHQDGLVHVSQLSDRFVRDASEVVRPGDRVTVKVLEVDRARRRLSLSMKSG